MTRSLDGPVRGAVYAAPPALLLWIAFIGTLALILAVIG